MGAKLGGGGGDSKYTVKQNSDINVTPFVDVMLVLLIIFMVTIPAATVSIKLDLPPAQSPPSNEKKHDPVFISIMGPQDIYIGSQKTTMNNLIGDVAAALRVTDPNTPLSEQRVLIRGDKDIEYEDFVKVLNKLQQNGYVKVGLITEDVD
ncbi:biopolymer transporter ExbD [Asticcacaulis sp. EMRT-3]|uniref:biopolymer transporter ExbD n=1 Tax=Asticcacaulis sp. EMRT-3 TaxID=3040349 RepID=UPI0024AE8F47|nr:biopolymer transporter ExbD [Asticcacaulis sp. EMRT-3]MDI7773775.1 biopolymer transporter ExbD [Asticcacaulis sp. EMRT-3]